jgi:hypothetical protein
VVKIQENTKALVDSKDYAEDLRQKLVAEERECDFWIDEAERFRNQVVELLRERAMRAKPGEL